MPALRGLRKASSRLTGSSGFFSGKDAAENDPAARAPVEDRGAWFFQLEAACDGRVGAPASVESSDDRAAVRSSGGAGGGAIHEDHKPPPALQKFYDEWENRTLPEKTLMHLAKAPPEPESF